MLRSMTGYGRGEVLCRDRKFVVEIKSVNHRYNDINIKLPRTLNSFEDKLRKIISSQVSRGKLDVYVSMESFAKDDVRISLNKALADSYVEQLHQVKSRYQLEDEISLSVIMRFPDVIEIEKRVEDEAMLEGMWEGLEMATKKAVYQFISMREAEGVALKDDIIAKNGAIKDLVEKVCQRAPKVAEDYRARLKARLDEVLADNNIDENRVLTEIAIFAERSSVDEELTRLSSHLSQLENILNEKDSIGRKLDFLIQEINREVNTIGSKSNDLELTRLVVDLKSEVEKIREQIQNIE